ncbi:TIGR02217 family protein [Terricaulis sp.]|uniref:phage distal tail protein, Rcc01695 family n=1 Tax=Terricaulis sp. TaxID=2768686 RepID=UPI0037838114
MSAFHEVSLPLPFALGASGGPERRVDIVALGSGRESRNTPWAHGRRRYDIGGAVRTLDELHALIAFFEARRGKLHGFRFRDPFDYKSCAPSQAVSAADQELGEGDGETVTFQIVKAYGTGDAAYARPIAKPLLGSVAVAVDGDILDADAFSIDAATGIITFEEAPGVSAAVTAGFLFDTPVRFDIDRLDLSLDGFGAGRALAVPLVEILV